MLMRAENSCLLVVDLQERLLPAIHEHERVLENTAWLMQIAGELEVPILVSEQYPRGLGHTEPRLLQIALSAPVMEKVHFSCAQSPACRAQFVETGRQQYVIVGTEAHVCVLQTALGLLAEGYGVFVVTDAVSSRRAEDARLALERMRQAGVQIVCREMVAFEWLGEAGTDRFRDISRRLLK